MGAVTSKGQGVHACSAEVRGAGGAELRDQIGQRSVRGVPVDCALPGGSDERREVAVLQQRIGGPADRGDAGEGRGLVRQVAQHRGIIGVPSIEATAPALVQRL